MTILKHALSHRTLLKGHSLKVSDHAIDLHARSIRSLHSQVCALIVLLALNACQYSSNPADKSASPELLRPQLMPNVAPASQPAGPTRIIVYIKTIAERKYGLLAHIIGKQDVTVRHLVLDPDKSWWDNPMIVYADAPFAHPNVIGQADAEAIVSEGAGANVTVRLTLVPHVDLAMETIPSCDGIKGSITVSITAGADFYDGRWTQILRTKDHQLTFSFNTCDPNRRLQEIAHESRTIPEFSLERYSRGHEKWEPMSRWPAEFKSGDARTVIYGKDAKVNVTAYRYAEP